MKSQHTTSTNTKASIATSTLVHALDNPLAFGHPIHNLRIIETHISWIILTGSYAYKIKKAVNFGFLDFSTLDQRRYYCHEELRLNRRFARQLYLDVIEIRGTVEAPRLHGDGQAIEYAIRMVEFPQQCLLSHHAASGTLTAAMVDAIADRISELHTNSDTAPQDSAFGSARSVRQWSEENLEHIAAAIPSASIPASYLRLQQWYQNNADLLDFVEQRKRDGRVRDCHGDLHLDNMTWIDNEVIPFDCIEFNAELRWIDTISEAAFVAMDLQARGYIEFGWRFISRYLESSADYDAVALLRYYLIYRALVRAKVEALRVDPASKATPTSFSAATAYLDLADKWSTNQRSGMIIMHGLSGSGKSTVAAQLVEALGAIRIRSDVVRKQIHSIDIDANTQSGLEAGIYDREATSMTYRHLLQIAQKIINAGFCVIVDATFLQEDQRRQMLQAESITTPCARIIVNCNAPEPVLRQRISTRKNDPSEANFQVLEQQMRVVEPITERESELAEIVEVGAEGLDIDQIDRINTMLMHSDNKQSDSL